MSACGATNPPPRAAAAVRFDYPAFSKEADRVRAEASRCRQPGQPEGRSSLSFVFEPNRPEPVVSFAYGKYQNTRVGDCVLALAKTIRVPHFDGAPHAIGADVVLGEDDGPPEGMFDRGSAAQALYDVTTARCYEGPPVPIHLKITFAPDGTALRAEVDQPPSIVGTAIASCVEQQFRTARVRPYAGSPVTIGKAATLGR